MTAIVGVLCRDGLVIGTDSSATFASPLGQPIIEQPTEKLQIVAGTIIIAGTGQIGLGQRFGRIIETAYEQRVFVGGQHYTEVGKEICKRTIADFVSTSVNKNSYGALVGFPLGDKPYLCEFPSSDFQPEFKTEGIWYCS